MNPEEASCKVVELLDKEVELNSLEALALKINGDRRLAARLFNNISLYSYEYRQSGRPITNYDALGLLSKAEQNKKRDGGLSFSDTPMGFGQRQYDLLSLYIDEMVLKI